MHLASPNCERVKLHQLSPINWSLIWPNNVQNDQVRSTLSALTMSLFNISHASHKLISSYQKKICCYDKQQWERSLEDHIIFRAESMASSGAGGGPRKASAATGPGCVPPGNSITNDLIDLDLISGAAYTMKSKSQLGWLSLLVHAVVRVLLLPLYLRWWSERTSPRLTTLLLTLYILQVTSMRLYFYKGFMSLTVSSFPSNLASVRNGTLSSGGTNKSTNEFGNVSLTEVLMPIAMMIVLGVLHTQIVGTRHSASSSSSLTAGTSTSVNGDRRNSTRIDDKEDCQSQHTDCSSSPLSSTTTSVESSPVSDNRHRMQTRLSKMSTNKSESARGYCREANLRDESTRNNIPKIRVHNVQKNQDIIIIDDNEYPADSNNNRCCRWSSGVTCKTHSSRRYSDSRNYSKTYHPPPAPYHPRRRYSDSNNNCSARSKVNQSKSSRTLVENGTVLRKRRSRLRKELRFRKPMSNNYDWSTEEPHLSLSPISLKSHLYSSYYGSSFDSEGTISPMTPLTSLPGDDWPMINSDINTSEVEEDEHHSPSVSDHLERHYGTQSHQVKSACQCDHQESSQEQSGWPRRCSCGQSTTLPGTNAHVRTYQSPKTNYRSGSSSGQKNAQENGSHTNHSNESIPSNELKVSCSVWQHNVCQKMDLSVMDISSSIIRKVESIEHSTEYVYLGLIFSLTVALLPALFRLQFLLTGASPNASGSSPATQFATLLNITTHNISLASTDLIQIDLLGLFNLFLDESFFTSKSFRVRFVVFVAMFERFTLSFFYFFLLCVAERTFKQRFLYSKYFSQLTRRDRAKRSMVPHFRLHKVRNLKAWLSVRSYLRRHGPHRSVDTICSTSFIIAICLLTCISLQILKDSSDTCTSRLMCWEMIFWSLALGLYIMRLMILGSRINQKYRNNLSVLITEQINLYLQLERKPHKKEALMLANHVLKLAVDLLKELESPYKISGFSANPYLYNITKVVVLSAFSAVLTEMLGFKLKLYKIKLIR